MFDKKSFAKIIKDIKETYENQEQFSEKSGVGRTYISQYMNEKFDNPPKPEILKRLADNSNGITTYSQLMQICGYIDEVEFNISLDKYKSTKNIEMPNKTFTLNLEGLDENDIKDVQDYIEFKKNQKKK